MLAVVVLTLNEAKNIRDCLESVRSFADDLIVFDSGSTDDTVRLAAESGARVLSRPFDDYARQRNAALAATSARWVLFIDADERASPELGEELRSRLVEIEGEGRTTALLWIPRRNFIFGKEIRYAGWSPDYQPRVLRRGRARFDETRPVHELVIPQGAEEKLSTPLVHYNYDTLKQFRAKQEKYAQLEAQMLFGQGIRPQLRSYVGQPSREFVRRFFTLRGYKDGAHGLVLSALMAYYAYYRHRILARMAREYSDAGC